MEDFFVSWYENCTIWLNFLFDVSVNLVRKKIGKLMVGRKEIRHSFGLDWYNGRKFYCWCYRLCQKKKVPYSSGLVWTSSSYSSSSSSSYSSSLKKKRKREYQPLCPSVEAYSLYSSSLLESYLSHDQRHQHVSSKTSLKPLFCLRKMCGYEKKQAALCAFCKQPPFRSFFL